MAVAAGKTSTLKILSGQAAPSSGDALIAGVSLTGPLGARALQLLVGYTPQVRSRHPCKG
jgi:ABC-type multidrug transport system ATPase subunit